MRRSLVPLYAGASHLCLTPSYSRRTGTKRTFEDSAEVSLPSCYKCDLSRDIPNNQLFLSTWEHILRWTDCMIACGMGGLSAVFLVPIGAPSIRVLTGKRADDRLALVLSFVATLACVFTRHARLLNNRHICPKALMICRR